MIATAPETFADVLHQLGDIPASRILWLPRHATEEDVLQYEGRINKRLFELVDGYLVEKAMGYRESLLAAWIVTCLNNFVLPRRLGFVGGADSFMRLRPGLVFLPDVSFVKRENLPNLDAIDVAVADFAPDLAVEVMSESNTIAEITRKRGEYFAAGTQLMWVVDPRNETVTVEMPNQPQQVLTTSDLLTGGELLPGFSLSVQDLFGLLERTNG